MIGLHVHLSIGTDQTQQDMEEYFNNSFSSYILEWDYKEGPNCLGSRNHGNKKLRAAEGEISHLELNSQWIEPSTYSALQRTASMTKDPSQLVPEPVVVTVKINQQAARALFDSGSLSNFMSSMLVD